MEVKEKILNYLTDIANEYGVRFVVVGSYAKGGYIYDPNNSEVNHSDIEIVVYCNWLKTLRIKKEITPFFNQLKIQLSLQKGRVASIPNRSLTLYEYDEIIYGIKIGRGNSLVKKESLSLHATEYWLLYANRQLELLYKRKNGLDQRRAVDKLYEAERLLCDFLECRKTELFNSNVFPMSLEVHENYTDFRSILVYLLRCRRFPGYTYGKMTIQIQLLKHLAAGFSLEEFKDEYLIEWRKSIGE